MARIPCRSRRRRYHPPRMLRRARRRRRCTPYPRPHRARAPGARSLGLRRHGQGAFTGIFLALVFLRLYYASRRRRLHGARGGRSPRRLLRSLPIADEDGGAAPSPRGLDPAVLRALPVAAAGAGAGDCAVCLAELEPGDEARALPRCGHRFHVECIDAWFRGNATCPLCRADVVVAGEEASAPPEVRIDIPGGEVAEAKGTAAPAMGRLPSGTDLDKTRRVASIRSASF
ncbi:hypothetical protein ACP4OV_020986 [Aristida adscensionis]